MVVLVGLGWLACQIEIPASSQSAETGWRRTINGWESTANWSRHETPFEPPLHPALLAAAELLLSLTFLVALPTAPAVRPAEVR